MPKNIYLILAITVLVIVVLVFFLVGFQIGKSTERELRQAELTNELAKKQEEIKFLQSKLEMFYPSLPEEIYSLSGKVTEIKDKTIIMETSVQVNRLPLPGGKEIEKQNIKVVVDDQTNITGFKTGIPLPLPLPEEKPRSEKTLIFSDIKIGDNILVTSTENIKGKKEITASQIKVIRESF